MDPFGHEKCELEDDGFRLDAETVIVSSLTDPAHDNVKLAKGNPRVINALDVATGKIQESVNGEPIYAIPAAEIPDHPEGTDDNALYAIKAGGLWFNHVGDLGFGLSNEELAPWSDRCDVLLVITGQKYTIKYEDIDKMIDFLKPKWMVPMHYHLPPLGGEGVPGGGMARLMSSSTVARGIPSSSPAITRLPFPSHSQTTAARPSLSLSPPVTRRRAAFPSSGSTGPERGRIHGDIKQLR